ncbi:MAG: LysM peptidoglycan-binding domain-containing protein [Chthoniobacterales bacterium]|nr:LysM peptidoglycan-binding domain-containing protein [Chthoniobacterales bacterium]
MKLQLFSKLTAKPRGRKVVRASARAMRGDEDYGEAEPNMKLSHAFMVVLVLHIVAVGGIWAFNHLNSAKKSVAPRPEIADKLALSAQPKTPVAAREPVAVRQPGDADDPLPTVAAVPAAKPEFRTADISPAPMMTATKTSAPIVESKPPAAKAEAREAALSKPASRQAATSAAGTYTVAKGDNPYKIAKKLGVSAKALLEANKIADPTKMQIGTVLKVPAKKN